MRSTLWEKKAVSVAFEVLQTNLDKLLFRKNEIKNTTEGYIKELEVISSNQRINSDHTDLSLEKLKQIPTYYRERSVEINNAIYKNQLPFQELDQKIVDFQNQMLKLTDQQKERRGEITLKL